MESDAADADKCLQTPQSALQLIVTALAGIPDWAHPELALAIALQAWVDRV
eukprot:COSAG05_NODE_10514_length_561_cov_0.945887_1_plen_50_part_01